MEYPQANIGTAQTTRDATPSHTKSDLAAPGSCMGLRLVCSEHLARRQTRTPACVVAVYIVCSFLVSSCCFARRGLPGWLVVTLSRPKHNTLA
jgi:hypothetical protein